MSKTLHISNMFGCFGAGILAFGVAGWLFFNQVEFFCNSAVQRGTVADVSYENVPRGRGSVMAYVPIVELENSSGLSERVKVDTSEDSPKYVIGSKMELRCAAGPHRVCRENRFIDLWASSLIALIFGLIMTGLGLSLRRRARNGDFIQPPLYS